MPGVASASVLDSPSDFPGSDPSDIVVIVPAYREEGGIRRVVEDVRQAVSPLVVVVNRPDDNGTDSEARSGGAVVIHQSGKGKGDAVDAGLDYVRRRLPDVRFIGFVDGDCTYPASPMRSMRIILQSNHSIGMVTGRRETLSNDGVKSSIFALGNLMLRTFHKVLNHVGLRDPLSGLRMVRADVLQSWKPSATGFDVECELNCYVHNVRGLGIVEIPIDYRPRVGKKKLGFRHGFVIMGRMIRLSFNGHRRTAPTDQPDSSAARSTDEEASIY